MLVGSTDQLEERLRASEADKQHAEGQEAAGQRILTQTIDEKNKLQDAKIKQAKELKDIRAQLSDALKENRKLKGGIFGMSSSLIENHLRCSCLVHNSECHDSVVTGLLTGRPEEEVSGFQGDVLKELSVVNAWARKAMRSMAKALWPSDTPLESMEGLANMFKGA